MPADTNPTLDPQDELYELHPEITYLNTAALAPRLRAVTEAGTEAVEWTARPWEISPEDWFTDPEHLRSVAAELFGVSPNGLAFVPSASYGLAVAAQNVPVERGESIVVLDNQFPSNVYVWRELARERDATVRAVSRDESGAWTRSVLAAIDDETAVVAVPNCHWTDGSLVDLERVGERARAVDAALVVDASQSLGARPLDFGAVDPDFLVSVGYKWLLGPYSYGYLYVAPEYRETGDPLEYTWLARDGSEDFSGLVDYEGSFRPGARRFDVGEHSNFVLVPMATAALEQLAEWGIENVEEYLGALTEPVASAARDLGCEVLPAEKRVNHMLGIQVPGGVPEELTDRFEAEGLIVSVRGDSIRVSPHLHTDRSDVDRLIGVMESVLG